VRIGLRRLAVRGSGGGASTGLVVGTWRHIEIGALGTVALGSVAIEGVARETVAIGTVAIAGSQGCTRRTIAGGRRCPRGSRASSCAGEVAERPSGRRGSRVREPLPILSARPNWSGRRRNSSARWRHSNSGARSESR